MKVSLILPAYNAEAFIADSIRQLLHHLSSRHRVFGEYEIILCDDGSTDRTLEIVRAHFPNIRIISLKTNLGKGEAVRQGMLSATGDFRLFIDCDLPYNLDVLDQMVHALEVQEFHVCIGSRQVPGAFFVKERRLSRKIASGLFTFFISRIVLTGVRDTQCGVKGFRGPVAEYLFSESVVQRFAFDVEILYLCYKNNLDVKRLPVQLVNEGISTVSLPRDSLRVFWDVVRIPFRYHLGRYRMIHDRI